MPVVRIGRLADAGFAADVSHRHAIGALLQNERLLGCPKTSMPSSLSGPPSLGLDVEDSTQNDPSFAASEQNFETFIVLSASQPGKRCGNTLPKMIRFASNNKTIAA